MAASAQTAQERLANPWWRLRHSAWMIAPMVSLGALAWVGFVYVAARTRKPAYVAIAGFFLVAGAVAGFWPDNAGNTQGGLLVFVWAAAIVTALVINPGYLRWRAGRGPSPQSAAATADPGFGQGPQDTVHRPGQARGPVFGDSGRWETPER